MGDELPPLGPHGRRPNAPRDARGKWLSEPKGDRVTSRGNSKTYIVKRLRRGGHDVLIGMIRRREISAYAAARKAGFGGPPRTHRPPKPQEPEPVVDVDTFVKALIA